MRVAGNAATRIEAFAISDGIRDYGGYPDIDALFSDQAVEMNKKRRETLLHKIEQLIDERSMFAPIVEGAALTGVRPPGGRAHHRRSPFTSPYEDLKLK